MRDPISDALAIAAMPELEHFAAVIDEVAPASRKIRRDNLSVIILMAVSRAFGSQQAAHSAMANGGLWEMMRDSAREVGRELPEAPPTASQVDHLLRAHGRELTLALERQLNVSGMNLARQMGLFDPNRAFEWQHPDRRHHVTGDGTTLAPLSEVTEDNKFERSRAADPAHGARVCEAYVGKPPEEQTEDKRRLGAPFVVASTHNGRRHQRIVLGLQTYRDGNEIGAAMEMFGRVIPLAQGGVHTVHYDGLMRDTHVAELLRTHGAMAIVPTPKAAEKHQHIEVPVDHPRYRRGGDKGGTARTKERLSVTHEGAFQHVGANGTPCWHRLWIVDGEPRVTGFNKSELTIDSPALQLRGLRRTLADGTCQVEATYLVPCAASGDYEITVDATAQPQGRSNDALALKRLTIGRLRFLNEADETYREISGRRSDSESTIDVIQRTMPLRARASRLDVDRFLWDLVGAALWINAQAWDVHVAQHTRAGAREHARQQRVIAKAA